MDMDTTDMLANTNESTLVVAKAALEAAARLVASGDSLPLCNTAQSNYGRPALFFFSFNSPRPVPYL